MLACFGCFFGAAAFLTIALYTAQIHRELTTEKRLETQAVDELRMETRQALRAAGVEVGDIQNHDVTVKEKP